MKSSYQRQPAEICLEKTAVYSLSSEVPGISPRRN
jgi:hypothetical protein